MLRLLHTSDWHIGQELHGHDRQEEHDAFLEWLIEQLGKLEVDALVVTGDIFDIANPPVSATARFYGFLRDVLARHPALQIVIVGGNHDSAARINLPRALLGRGRVHLLGQLPRFDGAVDFDALLVPLAGRNGAPAALLAAIPYCRPGDQGRGDLMSLYTEVTHEATERADGLPVVLTEHLHVCGGDVSADSERRIVIGGEEAQASTLFDARVAYVALGHLHRPQNISGATLIRYAGSPIALSVAERNYRHSVTVVDLGVGDPRVFPPGGLGSTRMPRSLQRRLGSPSCRKSPTRSVHWPRLRRPLTAGRPMRTALPIRSVSGNVRTSRRHARLIAALPNLLTRSLRLPPRGPPPPVKSMPVLSATRPPQPRRMRRPNVAGRFMLGSISTVLASCSLRGVTISQRTSPSTPSLRAAWSL